METLPTLAEILPFLAILLATGLIAGFLAGVFGIGGGAILVPVFYQMLGALGVDESVSMHLAVGTSLAIIVPTSLRSFSAHRAKGAVDMDLLKSWVIAVPLGVVIASLIAAQLSGAGLRIIFAGIALVVGLKLLLAREDWKVGSEIPGNPFRFAAGSLIGFFSTFMGIGGGVLNNTFMTLFGRPMHQAVATSAGTGVLISIPGVIGYIWAGWGVEGMPPFSIGYVNILALLVVMSVTIFVAPAGARVAHSMKKRHLEVAFGIFMLIVAARFFYSFSA